MGLTLGAYLSHPVTDKHSSNEENDKMSYGVSSMQGWRETQEDAHNCILDFDVDSSLFAVYDGHGGNEVSEYTSQHLPDFIKNNEYYKNGDYENALKDSFVKFDCTLKEPEVVKVLQKLAKYNECNDDDDSESDDENLGNLKAEAQMSIEEVMAKYVSSHKERKSNNSEVEQFSDKVANEDSVKFSEASSNEMECSSSKSNISFNVSDSEVSSSSSSCAITRKSLSEKYNSNGKSSKSPLDSTINGSNDSNILASSPVDRVFPAPGGVDCGIVSSKTESPSNKISKVEESEAKSEALVDNQVSCNGKAVEDTISSSVENGEAEESKVSKKGKALVKQQAKKREEKKSEESSEKLFQKFLNAESNEEMSGSDSDDVPFNGPESRSDDDDDEDDENDDGEADEADAEGEEEEEEDEDEDEDDDEDEDSEEYEYENEMDRCFMEPGSESGCTALVALIRGKKLYVANAGDCRCVVSKNGEAIEMSFDHKPENDIELKRIEKAGGRVSAGRVNDGLNLSRALGDHVYKRAPDLPPEEQMISPLPDIQVLDLDPDIEFMVLACDGIWNSMSSKEVIDFVRPKLLESSDNLSKICEELFDHCLAPNTLCDGTGCDNMTAIVVQFKDSKLAASAAVSRKRSLEESSEAEGYAKKQKTEDVTSTDSVGSSEFASNVDGFVEKPSDSPDTTQ